MRVRRKLVSVAFTPAMFLTIVVRGGGVLDLVLIGAVAVDGAMVV